MLMAAGFMQTAVGALVEEYMEKRGLTQPMLAARIGRSQAAISHLVVGTAGPSRNNAVYLGTRPARDGTVLLSLVATELKIPERRLQLALRQDQDRLLNQSVERLKAGMAPNSKASKRRAT